MAKEATPKTEQWELVIEHPCNVPERLQRSSCGRGHDLVVFGDGCAEDMIACRVCGHRATQRAVGLRKQCNGAPTSNHTKDVCSKLKEYVHPVSKSKLTKLAKLRPVKDDTFATQLQAFAVA